MADSLRSSSEKHAKLCVVTAVVVVNVLDAAEGERDISGEKTTRPRSRGLTTDTTENARSRVGRAEALTLK